MEWLRNCNNYGELMRHVRNAGWQKVLAYPRVGETLANAARAANKRLAPSVKKPEV